ncbi:MAG: hypothetical protein K0S33_2499 [Bacteroidetes bacterium]|jgi:uncharacterized membrane protein|nr:hypothetical protein [Bacteroidota bacterium]
MNQRDNSIDILRGFAIFAMVAANMSAHNYAEPHPFWFRIYGSFAAPTFVFLAGLMVGFTTFHKSYPLSYYLKRGLLVMLAGACIDMFCWGALPFATFDVLYVIGLSLPVAKLVMMLQKWVRVGVIGLLFLLTPVLQHYLGYNEAVAEPSLKLFLSEGWQGAVVWKQFLIDGWFPVFPWLGVSLLGAYIGTLRCSLPIDKANAVFAFGGTVMLTAGIVLWVVTKPVLVEREGYSELFYPPTLLFFLTFLGGVFVLLAALYYVRESKLLWFFSVYGKSSLLMYIMHTVFNVYIFNVFFGTYTLPGFAAVCMAHLVILWFIAYAVQYLKKGKKLPLVLSVILGG